MQFIKGSIDITKAIDAKQVKKVMCKDGREHLFVNVAIFENQEPREFQGRVYTHAMTCAPRKEEREEGVNYYLGNFETVGAVPQTPSYESIEGAGFATLDDLPF